LANNLGTSGLSQGKTKQSSHPGGFHWIRLWQVAGVRSNAAAQIQFGDMALGVTGAALLLFRELTFLQLGRMNESGGNTYVDVQF
jgi:hypothetical protein